MIVDDFRSKKERAKKRAVTRQREKIFQVRKKKVNPQTKVEEKKKYRHRHRSTIRGRKIDFENSQLEKKAFSVGLPTGRVLGGFWEGKKRYETKKALFGALEILREL